jgi:hypothetical protein
MARPLRRAHLRSWPPPTSVRTRHGGWPTRLSREALGSNGSLRQIVVALADLAPRKRPPPAHPYLWLRTGTRELAERNVAACGRGRSRRRGAWPRRADRPRCWRSVQQILDVVVGEAVRGEGAAGGQRDVGRSRGALRGLRGFAGFISVAHEYCPYVFGGFCFLAVLEWSRRNPANPASSSSGGAPA